MGYAPINIERASAGLKKEITIPGFGKRVKLKDLAVMARQFATMINSGLSLLSALRILSEQTENKELARVLGEVRTDVESGTSLSAAMAKLSPDVFPPLMVNMAKAGEVGGFLDAVLLQVAENYESEVKLRGKIKSAMTYPTVVFFMAICCDRHAALHRPDLCQDVQGSRRQAAFADADPGAASDMLKYGAPVSWFARRRAVRLAEDRHTDGVRNVVDPMKLKLPVFGKLFQKIALGRFSRNLGTMLHSGVPILQSLDIVADTTGNVVLSRAVGTFRRASEPARASPARWRTTRSSRRWSCR